MVVDRVEQVLKNIEEKNDDINAILHLNPDALTQAKQVQKKIKEGKAGKLAGKTIVLKSCISVADLPVTCASKVLENHKGTFDADVVRRIKEEDGVIIGMANMDEFASGSSGENSAFGPTKNPLAPDLIPGGSSSGSAAAVAAGFCDIALGTDTGGSIRNPASHCGIVGVKPSYGRVSRYGVLDLSMSLDQVGPLAANTQDAALMMQVISGHSQNDPTTIKKPIPKVKKAGKLTIGVSEDFYKLCEDDRIVELTKQNIQEVADKTDSKIKEVKMPYVDLAIQTYYPLVYVEFFSATRKYDGRRFGKKFEEACGEETLRRVLGGNEISKAEHGGMYYRKALKAKKMIRNAVESAFKDVDVLMLPTTPMLPHKLGSKIDAKTMYAYDAFTIPANLAGCTAGVIPAGLIQDAPVGVQVMAPAFSEDVLLSVMKSAELDLTEAL